MRIYKCVFFFLLWVLVAGSLAAQQVQRPAQQLPNPIILREDAAALCGVDRVLRKARHDAAFKAREARMNEDISLFQRPLDDDTVFIPVVFHIISMAPWDVPDQLLVNALKNLNDAFSKSGKYASGQGVDTKIRFCLARNDPDGGNTTGITRTESFFSTHLNPLIEDERLKNLVQWDPARYANIWLISSMDLESFADFVCGKWTRTHVGGYATMPPGGDALDGIVLSSLDVSLVHEMGHYLGLYHTFEGRNCVNNDCTTDGDRVCDTPPEYTLGGGGSCDDPQNSCSTDTLSNYSNGNFPKDVPDQNTNFMDYGNPACHNAFTRGQADRMHAAIHTQRSGLLQNECDPPCSEPIKALFTRDLAYPQNGNAVRFTNNSTGANDFQWLVNGSVVGSGRDLVYTFAAPGKYKVSLKAFNTAACYAMYTDYVIVHCGVTARFYTDKRVIASKTPIYPDTILFNNNSENATSFQWLVSNDQGMAEQVVSTSRDLRYLFETPANYFVRLVATNGSCIDTTLLYTIPVLDPTQDGVAQMTAVDCYQKTKVRVTFSVCNFGFATIPAGVPISFYDADPRLGNAQRIDPVFHLPDSIPGKCCGYSYTYVFDVHRAGLNTLYMVFNDSGNTMPLSLPNTTLREVNYENNIAMVSSFSFNVTASPESATLEPGDTLQLTGTGGPGAVTSVNWSPALNLSCTACASPYLVADSDRVKMFVATSQYGCPDTAFVTIKVPPANDYTVALDAAQCASGNRLHVDFTLRNSFRRGVLPKDLAVAFYDGDPAKGAARLLPPVFFLPDTVFAKEGTFSTFIAGTTADRVYAVVNDSGSAFPVQFPGNRLLPEKNYPNNFTSIAYPRETVRVTPADTTVWRTSQVPLRLDATVYNPASTRWDNGDGYTLSCNACSGPVATVYDSSGITVQTENRFGCLVSGVAVIKVFPPDFTVRLVSTDCYSNATTLVRFEICVNNRYDSLPGGLPVVFYDGDPAAGGKMLAPVFRTRDISVGDCHLFEHIVSTPGSGFLFARVNDASTNGPGGAVLAETDHTNNGAQTTVEKFRVQVNPPDTSIQRSATVQLHVTVSGGAISRYAWQPNPFLSCLDCLAPVVTPLYTKDYVLVAANQYACVDTAYAVVKTVTGGDINMPSAFSPNGDGLNDIFYVLGGPSIPLVKTFNVFDRWGKKMFEVKDCAPNDPRFGWDGTISGSPAAPGAYVYLVRVQRPDGKQQVYKGSIVLLR